METFIFLNGIEVKSDIRLGEGIVLQPADTSYLDLTTALSTCRHPDDIAVVAAFIPRVRSQFQISAKSSPELSVSAWNSSWDALLLSAIFQKEIGFNIQSDTTAHEVSAKSTLRAVHRQMSGFNDERALIIQSKDALWLTDHFVDARQLMSEESFKTGVHCLASMHWHPHPRIKLAIIWAGIEGIFGASTEIRFKISLYMARFLAPEDVAERKAIFELVKKLYSDRSKAVHGSKLKGDLSVSVADSATLLNKLLIKCIEVGSLPKETELVP
ncbi:hypothetical protein [Sulfitobacter sp.]|uniref:hypothetical protein n=1 Tax=Sulfitobacter sp. TaxID=1903071 RepID=UPI003001614E